MYFYQRTVNADADMLPLLSFPPFSAATLGSEGSSQAFKKSIVVGMIVPMVVITILLEIDV